MANSINAVCLQAVSAAASFAAVAAVFIAVTETQKQPIKRLVQNGCTVGYGQPRLQGQCHGTAVNQATDGHALLQSWSFDAELVLNAHR